MEGPANAIPAAIALYFYARYDIDKKRHAEIQAALRERHANDASAAQRARVLARELW